MRSGLEFHPAQAVYTLAASTPLQTRPESGRGEARARSSGPKLSITRIRVHCSI
jgi:hypothetical protein